MRGKILIIDDSDKIRQDVRQALAGEGFEILEAVDGQDGFEKLHAHQDLVLALCDVNMPRMTGLELLAALSRDPPEVRPRTPILMLTTEGQPSMIRRAREHDAKGWIIKPFKTELLVGAVRKLIAAAAGTPATPPAPPAP